MKYIIDIEGNDLLANSLNYKEFPYKLHPKAKLWCIVIKNITTGEVKTASLNQCTKEWLKEALFNCEELIGHNLIKFDLPMLKLFGILDYTVGELYKMSILFGKPVVITDTLILSRLLNPDRFGGHALKKWGQRLGFFKTDFRQVCIDKGYIPANSEKGAEFKQFCPEMIDYCNQDVSVTEKIYEALMKEKFYNPDLDLSLKQENKLADRALDRETLGFWFNKPLALQNLEDLNNKMTIIEKYIVPLLPPKPMNIGELKDFTPPAKQLNKVNQPTSHMIKFVDKIGGILIDNVLIYKGEKMILPLSGPLETHTDPDIKNFDHIKMFLIENGWEPTEVKVRDLTKDSKKQNLPYDKRIKAMNKWLDETFNGKYTELRLNLLGRGEDKEHIRLTLTKDLKGTKPVKVPTSPCIKVGLEKELCPNLIALGEKVAFAKDYSDYLTYKHRRNCIVGGFEEETDYGEEEAEKGYLASYREEDSRIPTPAVEIGAGTFRYLHKGVVNVPRITSLYGKEMRSLFGCGPKAYQGGYDFAALEARIMGHYCYNFTNGKELAEMLIAEKPNDIHTVNAAKLDISRTDAKSFFYGIIYGASPKKLMTMLNCSLSKAQELYDTFWETNPALKELKDKLKTEWERTGKNYISAIDGRRLMIRSEHSILNFLFQSAGVIVAKYVTIFIAEEIEKQGYITSPFIGKPDVCSMIEMHDKFCRG